MSTKRRRYQREWQRKHAKQHRIANARWKRRNKDRVNAYRRKYYKKFSDKEKKYAKKYAKRNAELYRAATSRRRTRVSKAGGSFTPEEFKNLCAKYDNRCLACGKKVKLTADHVIPVSKGGTSNINNIQPLCKPCNCKKKTRTTDFREVRKCLLPL